MPRRLLRSLDQHAAWVITLLVAGSLVLALADSWQTKRTARLEEQRRVFEMAYAAAAASFRHAAEEVFFGVLSQPQVLDTLLQANLLEGRARDLLRGRLYRHIAPHYDGLRHRFASQIQFHLASGDSFLRMYLPEYSGESATMPRPLVTALVKERRMLEAFEAGRALAGQRYIFPLWRGDTFVGAVEVVVSIPALLENMRHLMGPGREVGVMVRREQVLDLVRPEEQATFSAAPLSSDFLLPPQGWNAAGSVWWDAVQAQKENPALRAAVERGEAAVVESRLGQATYAVAAIPLLDSRGQASAYLVEVMQDDVLMALNREFAGLVAVGATGMVVVLVLVWRLHQSRLQLARERRALLDANQQLQRSEARTRFLSAAAEQSPVAIVVTDTTGTVLFANAACSRMTGYGAADLVGHDVFRLHSGYSEDAMASMRAALAHGQPWSGELSYRFEDGTIFWAQVMVSPVRDDAGRITHFIFVQEDISLRKQMEAELRHSLEFQQALLESLPVGIVVVDATTQEVERINGEAERLLGMSARTVIGARCSQSICSGAHTQCPVTNEGSFERHFCSPDGTERDLLHSVRRISVHGEEKFLGCLVDISERKAAERALAEANQKLRVAMERARSLAEAAEAASHAKGRFLAAMSHEIRTPMHAVLGMLHLALQTALAPKQRDYLEKAQGAAQALLGLLNDILDFSKIEAGKLTLERTSVAVFDVLENVATVVGERLRGKDVELVVAVEPSVPWTLVTDGLRLSQILVNLAGNAAKFTEQGEIEIRMRAEPRGDDGWWLRVMVRDTGVGMRPEELARVLEPFAQADASTARRYGGTGLGLAITAELVRLMGGAIHLESQQGEGTRAYVSLQCDRDVADAAIPVPSELAGGVVVVLGGRPASRTAWSLAVEFLGLRSVAAESVDAAHTALSEPAVAALVAAEVSASEARAAAALLRPGGRLVAVISPGEDAPAWGVSVDAVLDRPVLPPRLLSALLGEAAAPRPQTAGVWQAQGTVLVAEDNPLNQQIIQSILEGAGLSVHVVDNGAAALEAVQKQSFDVVLMDVEMPDMDGLEATRRIHAHAPHLPVVAMTAYALAEERQRMEAAGMVDHVSKPVDIAHLFEVLGRFVPVQRQERPEAATPAQPSGLAFLRSRPGWKVDEAVERMGGDTEAYTRLLGDMVEAYRDLDTEVRVLVDRGEPDAARAKVHALRGIAGNAGAAALYAVAGEVEEGLRSGNWNADVDAALRQALGAFVHEVRCALGEKEETAASPVAAACGVSDPAQALEQLAVAVEARRPRPARQLWEQLRGCFRPEAEAAVREMDQCLGEYAFDRARELVDQLREMVMQHEESGHGAADHSGRG
ncbi:MAG: two-component hybrid sensor and regulator [Desulfomicrobiaceae bacterium]|nr:two-component hybrid sensor and regulator [Desulfomicrobiaceae bacterium]